MAFGDVLLGNHRADQPFDCIGKGRGSSRTNRRKRSDSEGLPEKRSEARLQGLGQRSRFPFGIRSKQEGAGAVVEVENSQQASITSSPLFIIVAESTEIFRPICQFG